MLKRQGISHLVLAGEIRRRPQLTKIRPTPSLLAIVPSVIMALARGDDGLLKVLTRGMEKRGITVVGAHEIIPELAAGEGTLTTARPRQSDWHDIEAGRVAAKAIGALDIGQAAIAVGGRVIALEGIEGTNGLLERTRELRGHGRLAGKTRGVLVKCAKPGQELRADLPSIGPQTVESAHAAGLAGIAVEAGRSLILEGPETLSRANALGLFIVGLAAKEPAGPCTPRSLKSCGYRASIMHTRGSLFRIRAVSGFMKRWDSGRSAYIKAWVSNAGHGMTWVGGNWSYSRSHRDRMRPGHCRRSGNRRSGKLH